MLDKKKQYEIIQSAKNGAYEMQLVKCFNISRTAARRYIKIAKILNIQKIDAAVAMRYILSIKNEIVARCPTCGKIVLLPCRYCITKQYMEITGGKEPEDMTQEEAEKFCIDHADDIKINLKDPEKERYAQIVKWRQEIKKNPNFVPPYDIPETDLNEIEEN